MPNYNDISRRGLIELNNDFDKKSDNALYNFLNNSEKDYEEIRPYERVAEKLDEVTEAIQAKGGIISNAMVDRVNHIFDNMINGLTDEIDRCESVMDEQNDDNAYPDSIDDEEDEEDSEALLDIIKEM